MRVPFDEVPLDVRRRAARMLATLTAGHVFPKADRRPPEPTLGPEACPLFRPDLDEIAYWEIELAGVTTSLTLPGGDAKEHDAGFLVLAAGAHDVPIPHFSLELAPPTRRLEAMGGAADRAYKLDSLCYVAEDGAGTMLAHIGTMPPKLGGLPAELPKRPTLGWAHLGDPTAEAPEDGEKARRAKLRRSREVRTVEAGTWRSWEECKRGYAETYGLHLRALAQRAAHPWQLEELTTTFGQGIRSGVPFTVLLLGEGGFELTGAGADLVSAELNPQPLPPRVVLLAKADASVRDTSFDLHLRYGGGGEVLPFFIVPEDAPSTVVPTPSPLGPVFGGDRR